MHINQLNEQFTIAINNKKDLDKISNLKIDLALPRFQQKVSKYYRVSKTEPLLVYELDAKVQEIIPLKEATVEVTSITVTLVKTKYFKLTL